MNNKKLMINFYSLFFLKTIGQFRMIVVRRWVPQGKALGSSSRANLQSKGASRFRHQSENPITIVVGFFALYYSFLIIHY